MFDKLKTAAKKLLGTEIASRSTDPNFYGALRFLPNPDPILRKMGKHQEVYDAIMADAHVIGEIRPMRANIISFEWRIQPGGDAPEDLQAYELAQQIYATRPDSGEGEFWRPVLGWPDVFWNMHEAILKGQRIHEVVWGVVDGKTLPVRLIDRPNRRFIYGTDNELRLLTRDNMMEGVPVDPYKFLVSRHMPSFENPYGVALLSSCFWPYTFKHMGFKTLVKFCEKHGVPWPVAKYPPGSGESAINELADRLAAMVEDALAVIPSDGSVELLENKSGGSQLPQERLIQVCNAEMSKALNSQTLASEIIGNGSRAAAETHRGREQDNGAADRRIVEDTNNELLQWLTWLNFANAKPPTFEFYEESEARQEWVDVFDKARGFIQIPTAFAHERLQIPQPVDGEEVLPSAAPMPAANFSAAWPTRDFVFKPVSTDPSPVTDYTRTLAADSADIIQQWIETLRGKLNTTKSLEAYEQELLAAYGDLPPDELAKVMEFGFSAAELAGMFDVQEGQ